MPVEATPQDLKGRFFRVYANVPLQLRDEVIIVIDNQPVSWQAAFIEVRSDSENGRKIVSEMAKLDLI